jgi:formylglycine-generating enzyme required for sulfatase activity
MKNLISVMFAVFFVAVMSSCGSVEQLTNSVPNPTIDTTDSPGSDLILYGESNGENITSFSINGFVGSINDTNILVTLPYGVPKTSLSPIITVSTAATVLPASGTPQDFTEPVTYTVTGLDGTTKSYVATVLSATASDKDITVFSILGVAGVIGTNTISVTLPFGTNLSSLTPQITHLGASILPAIGATNFSSPVTYTVTAADASHKAYVVTATVAGIAAGSKVSFTAEEVSFNMAYVPGGLTFPTGTSDNGTASVTNAYFVAETELTYELWYKVKTWADAHGYVFLNDGAEGKSGIRGAAPTAAKNQPVVWISWRDAMIFSNALTEWYNDIKGTTYSCAYYTDAQHTTPIRVVTEEWSINGPFVFCTELGCQDNPYVKEDATGFRMLTSNEWELAARYKDGTSWTPGNYVSGATAPQSNAEATQLVAWYSANAAGTTHNVKGKLANALGLYDMAGNVFEWSFSGSSPSRIVRGGSFKWDNYMQVGNAGCTGTLIYQYNDLGFRFGRTAL